MTAERADVQQIKDRIDIVSVISRYVTLTKAGSSYKGRCPFHKDDTPSFWVSPEKGLWHCFGCGAGGD
ncbi:MAG TPA: DNA primase, partial [Candidatus Acetothermia bacterium]|nr:DNA primase [Candidatus Acetothermia bacterium]HEX32698.1 DNA primase [Candidatus Acetothermia bacterium]